GKAAQIDAACVGASKNRLEMVLAVELRPRLVIAFLPHVARHLRVVGDDVLKCESVEISVHVNALGSEYLVVLRARQRRQHEELEHDNRQLLLNVKSKARPLYLDPLQVQ